MSQLSLFSREHCGGVDCLKYRISKAIISENGTHRTEHYDPPACGCHCDACDAIAVGYGVRADSDAWRFA